MTSKQNGSFRTQRTVLEFGKIWHKGVHKQFKQKMTKHKSKKLFKSHGKNPCMCAQGDTQSFITKDNNNKSRAVLYQTKWNFKCLFPQSRTFHIKKKDFPRRLQWCARCQQCWDALRLGLSPRSRPREPRGRRDPPAPRRPPLPPAQAR